MKTWVFNINGDRYVLEVAYHFLPPPGQCAPSCYPYTYVPIGKGKPSSSVMKSHTKEEIVKACTEGIQIESMIIRADVPNLSLVAADANLYI